MDYLFKNKLFKLDFKDSLSFLISGYLLIICSVYFVLFSFNNSSYALDFL